MTYTSWTGRTSTASIFGTVDAESIASTQVDGSDIGSSRAVELQSGVTPTIDESEALQTLTGEDAETLRLCGTTNFIVHAKDLGCALKAAGYALGLTSQSARAAHLGVSTGTLSSAESGTASDATLTKAALGYGIRLDTLKALRDG